MEHLESQLPALDLRLERDVLDRIDEIVPPGTDLNVTDVGWVPAAIADPSRCAGGRARPGRHVSDPPYLPGLLTRHDLTGRDGIRRLVVGDLQNVEFGAPFRHDIGRKVVRGRGQCRAPTTSL